MSYDHSYVINHHKCDLNQRFFSGSESEGEGIVRYLRAPSDDGKEKKFRMCSHLSSDFIASKVRHPHDHSALVKNDSLLTLYYNIENFR